MNKHGCVSWTDQQLLDEASVDRQPQLPKQVVALWLLCTAFTPSPKSSALFMSQVLFQWYTQDLRIQTERSVSLALQMIS
jgi:hypothetical protein